MATATGFVTVTGLGPVATNSPLLPSYSYAYSDCLYDYTAVANCDSSLYGPLVPTCDFNFLFTSDTPCCTSWLSWEYNYLSCLETAYTNCFDFQGYTSYLSDEYPCYISYPFTQSAVASATITVPSLILEPITIGPPTPTPTHSPISSYTGQGSLLQGYCATPDYVLLDGPTAYWAPAVGCVGAKTDCCPYAVQQATAGTAVTVTVVSTTTVNVGPSGVIQQDYAGLEAYPIPVSANQATLAHCPDDYQPVSGGCCPNGYQLWNAPLGGETPCYSSLSSTLVPPAVPVGTTSQEITLPANVTAAVSTQPISTANQKPTSAIVNIVYAIRYPVEPSSGLSTGAKAGIGAGAGVAGIAIITLSILLIWRTRKHKNAEKKLSTMQAAAPATNGQTQSVMSAVPPYPYSPQTDGTLKPPDDQPGYFPPQQMPQGQPQSYYGQQPMQQGQPQSYYGQQPQLPEMQGQSPVHYPSPTSGLSPQPTGSDGYGYQTGYSGTIPSSISTPPPPEGYGYQTGHATSESVTHEMPSSTGSPAPPDGYGYQTGYAAPDSVLHEMPSSTGSPQAGEGYGNQGGYNPPGEQPYPHAQELHGQSPPGEMHG